MKKFMIGLIIGAGLMFSVSAHAEVISYVGKIIEGQFPIKVDGEAIESPGIVIDGTSYLPTRTIAELAGFEVAFTAEMGVELTKKTDKVKAIENRNLLTKELENVNLEIQVLNDGLADRETVLNNPFASEEAKQKTKDFIEKENKRISELQARKAEIEALLAAEQPVEEPTETETQSIEASQ